jgi:hypothetical protein
VTDGLWRHDYRGGFFLLYMYLGSNKD